MLKFYRKMIKTYKDNELICYHSGEMLTNEEPKAERFIVSWENLEEIGERFGFYLPYAYHIFKKGKVIYFFDYFPMGMNKKLKSIKEWKQKETNIHIEISYMEYTPSISEVLDWHDGNKAIQYLKERGLTINGK